LSLFIDISWRRK